MAGFGSGAVELGVGYVSVVPSAKGFQKELDKQLSQASSGAASAGEKVGNSMSSGMSKALKVGGAAAGAAAVAGIGVAITKGFSRLNQIDQARAKLSGLGHEAGSVEKIMDSALAAVKGTAFGMGDAATVAAATVAAGVKPGQELERTLKLMGDAATIAGTDMATMGSIVNKVATSDMMQMDVANQLMDAGIPILQMVADEMGVTAGEARKLASDGKVSFETFQNALDKGLGGAALKSGETLQGSLNNLMASVGRLGEAMLKPFMGEGKGLIASLTGLSDTLTDKVGPAMESFAGWLANTAVPALRTAGEWVQRNRDWIAPLAVAIGSVAAVWATWTGAIAAWQTVTKVATAVQLAFNAVMAANPIMLVIMAVAALVAGLVYFFTQTETGKAIWESFTAAMAAGWAWVQNAFAVAWAFIQPILTSLWNTLTLIGQIVFAVFATPFVLAWQIVSAAVMSAWNSTIRPVWDAMKIGLQALGAFFQWVWNSIIKPAWTALGAGIAFVWTSVINPAWNALKSALSVVGQFFQNTWNNVIKPAWDALGNGIRTVINNVIMPAWEVMKSGLDTIKGHFSTAVSAITSVWDTLSGALRKPIDFLINVVWNRGLVPAWNTVQGFLPGLPRANPMPGFATGGAVSGPGTGTSDSIIAKLSAGEHVLTAAEVRAIGGQGVVYALRSFIKEGRPFTFDGRGGLAGLPRHLNNRVGDLAGAAPDLLIPRYAKGGEVRPAWESQLEAGHAFAQKIAPAPYILGGSSGGRPGGPTDCSGFMSEIADVILGGPGGTRKWATGSFPGPQAGAWASGLSKGFSVGIVHGGPAGGHTAGTLSAVGNYSAVNVESGGGTGQGATYGGAAVGADHGQFTEQHHLKIGADGAFESAGGPSPAQQLAIIKKKIKEILDKALEPIRVGMAQAIGSPPPPYLDIPPQGLTRTKDTAVDTAFGFAEKLGDKLRSVYDTAKNVTASITGLFRDKGGFIPAGKSIVNNETGKPEAVLNWDQLQQVIRLMESAAGLAALQEWAHGDPTAAIAQGVSEETVKAVEAVGERIAAEVAVMTDTFEKTWREGMLEDALGVFGVGQVGGTVGAAMKALADPDLLKPKTQDDESTSLSRVSTALPGAADFGYENTTVDLETKMPDLDTSSPGSGPVKDQVREAFSAYGWDKDPYWAAVDWIVGKESTWNPTARNPSSGAFGLFQFLGGTKQQYLPDENTNPKVQGAAGAKYIKDRYGDPLKAKSFWEQNGWYDRGGWLKPGVTLTRNDTGKPEAILNPAQWSMISRQIDVVEQMANGSSGATYNVYATDVDEAMKRLQLREAQRAQTFMGAR